MVLITARQCSHHAPRLRFYYLWPTMHQGASCNSWILFVSHRGWCAMANETQPTLFPQVESETPSTSADKSTKPNASSGRTPRVNGPQRAQRELRAGAVVGRLGEG